LFLTKTGTLTISLTGIREVLQHAATDLMVKRRILQLIDMSGQW